MSEGQLNEVAAYWPYLAIVAGGIVTYAWRGLGVALSGRIDPHGAVFEWVACVAYALLAGLIARMIVLPVGPLAETPMGARVAAAIIALAIFFALRRNIGLGVAAGAGALLLLSWAWG